MSESRKMSEPDLLMRLLGTEGEDSGCDGGFAVLAEYVERELEGANARDLLPAVAAHLRNCPACSDDYEGLVALAREPRVD
jgi:hypothetical protein